MVKWGRMGRFFVGTVFVVGMLATFLPGCSSVNTVVNGKVENVETQPLTFEADTQNCYLEWKPVATKVLTDAESKKKNLSVPLGNYWALEWQIVNNCSNALPVAQKSLTISDKSKAEYDLTAKKYIVKNKVVALESMSSINPGQKYNVIMYYDMPLGAKPSKDYKVGVSNRVLFSPLEHMRRVPLPDVK